MNAAGWKCSRCKAHITPSLSGGSGRAIVSGKTACYRCADELQRNHMKRAVRAVAYVSSDGRTVTTWTGGHLATVERSRPIRLTRYSYTFGNSILSLKVRDVHGNAWVGRSAPGMYIKLRRVKS